jgi:hypothetical protein
LIHRLFHTDKIGEKTVFHYADSFDECTALAIEDPKLAVRNAHTLQYFALDVYAYDISVPGQGCTGEPVAEEESEAPASSASSASASATSSATSSSTSSAEAAAVTAPTSTTDAAESTTESATESAQSVSYNLY